MHSHLHGRSGKVTLVMNRAEATPARPRGPAERNAAAPARAAGLKRVEVAMFSKFLAYTRFWSAQLKYGRRIEALYIPISVILG